MRENKNKLIKIIFISSLIGIINGLLGGGGGMLCVPALTKIGGLDTKKAHATAVYVMLPISIISSIVYAISTKANFGMLSLVTVGSLIGGLIGTKFLKNFESIIIEYIFVAVILLAGIRMLI